MDNDNFAELTVGDLCFVTVCIFSIYFNNEMLSLLILAL